MKDLIILVADQKIRFCIEGLIPRLPYTTGIVPFQYDIFSHPNRDPGCRAQSSAFLGSFQNRYRFALVIFDKEGCGRENLSREGLEEEVEEALAGSGWNNRAKAIAIDPELENWIWVRSPQLSEIINWESIDSLYQWLFDREYLKEGDVKPNRPKEAFEEAMRFSKKQRSSAIYKQIATQVSFKRCTDESFLKFIQCMKDWFGNQ